MAGENLLVNSLLTPETLALMGAVLAVVVIVCIAVWIYQSFAFMAIGKKAKLSAPGLAWIPGIGPIIIAFQASKMHWWPWLLFLSLLIAWIPVVGYIIYMIAIIILAVYGIIWQWKMFEAVKRPGWWAIICLIPIVNLILYGIAAWSKD